MQMKRRHSLNIQSALFGGVLASVLVFGGAGAALATEGNNGHTAPPSNTGIVNPNELNIPGFTTNGSGNAPAPSNPTHTNPAPAPQRQNNQASEEARKKAKAEEEARKKAADQEKQRKAAEAQQKKRDEAKMAAQKKADQVSKLSQVSESKTVSAEPPVSADVSAAATTADASGVGMNPSGTLGFSKDAPADMTNISWMSGTPGYWFTSPVFPIVALLIPLILILAALAALLMRTRFGNELLEAASLAASSENTNEAEVEATRYYEAEQESQMQTQMYEQTEEAPAQNPLDDTAYNQATFENINPGDTFVDRMRFKLNKDK